MGGNDVDVESIIRSNATRHHACAAGSEVVRDGIIVGAGEAETGAVLANVAGAIAADFARAASDARVGWLLDWRDGDIHQGWPGGGLVRVHGRRVGVKARVRVRARMKWRSGDGSRHGGKVGLQKRSTGAAQVRRQAGRVTKLEVTPGRDFCQAPEVQFRKQLLPQRLVTKPVLTGHVSQDWRTMKCLTWGSKPAKVDESKALRDKRYQQKTGTDLAPYNFSVSVVRLPRLGGIAS